MAAINGFNVGNGFLQLMARRSVEAGRGGDGAVAGTGLGRLGVQGADAEGRHEPGVRRLTKQWRGAANRCLEDERFAGEEALTTGDHLLQRERTSGKLECDCVSACWAVGGQRLG